MDDTRCSKCGAALAIGDYPFCPHGRYAGAMVGDEFPGGKTFDNLGHEPVTVYSKSELKREMDKRGLKPFVRHVGVEGSDKSPHTTRHI